MKEKIDSLQFVRAFAAIWVLVTHVFQNLDIKPLGDYYLSGQYGVDVFFILSGFIIYLTTRERAEWKHFFVKRVFRIFPAYLFCLACYWCYFIVTKSEHAVYDLWGGVKNILLFPCSDRILPNSLMVGQAWSTCYEMYFYIIMTAVLIVGLKKNRVLPILAVLFVVAWLSRKWLMTFGFGRYLFSLLGSIHIYKFCIGIVVAIVYDKLNKMMEKVNVKKSVKWAVFIVLQIFVLAMFFMSYRHYLAPLASIIMFVSWLLMNRDLCVFSERGIYKVLKWFGDISYSLYLVHLLVIYIFVNQCHVGQWWLLLPLTLGVAIGFSSLSYIYIEKPGMNLAKRIINKNNIA